MRGHLMPTAGNAPCPAHPPATTRTLLLATDLQQSILAELDRSGPNLRAYTAYGSPSSLRPTSAGLGFNGQLGEHPTGWHHLGNGHRVYNPVLMRFHSPDRLSPFGEGGVNAYAYCGGSPIGRVDPSGQSFVGAFGQSLGVAVGPVFGVGAFLRTASAIVNGQVLPTSARLANTFSFVGGVTATLVRPLGLPAAISAVAPVAWQAGSVIGNVVSQASTFAGGFISNVNLARTTLAKAQATGQVWATTKAALSEVSGSRLVRGLPFPKLPAVVDQTLREVVEMPRIAESSQSAASRIRRNSI
jgi:RHS repeat-associated protein